VIVEKNHLQFFTAVSHEWLRLLEADEAKLIIIEALRYRISVGQIKVCAFVIMPNHIHLIWRVQNGYNLEDVQRDFLKYTAKELIALLKRKEGELGLEKQFVGLKDRTLQVWKRNSMSIDLVHEWFFNQKFDYLHNNPCQPHWNLAERPEEYRYSSARYYEDGIDEFGLITHFSKI
jgi:putative transposase